jgi:hypothetical protein
MTGLEPRRRSDLFLVVLKPGQRLMQAGGEVGARLVAEKLLRFFDGGAAAVVRVPAAAFEPAQPGAVAGERVYLGGQVNDLCLDAGSEVDGFAGGGDGAAAQQPAQMSPT